MTIHRPYVIKVYRTSYLYVNRARPYINHPCTHASLHECMCPSGYLVHTCSKGYA